MVVPTYVSVALPVVIAFTFILGALFMNRERELIIEDKARDNSPAHRNEIMSKANSIAFAPVIISTVLAIYLGINFFGFGVEATSPLFLVLIIGVLLAALFVSKLQGPLAQALYTLFYKNANAKPKVSKKVKKGQRANKSAEPEEATFIGIND
jgi:K+-sensing histidine kinase KdpD